MAKHEKTLRAVFTEPTLGTIKWLDIEALFKHHGAEISEGKGSRVRILFKNTPHTFHRPHPRKETVKGAVETVRRIFREAGIVP